MLTRRKIITSFAAALISGICFLGNAFAQNAPQVTFETSMGNITIELDMVNAPETSSNFLNYARSGFYDGTVFHRVIDGFMIQGGGFTKDMEQKQTEAPIKLEISALKNTRGTVAMARTGDPHSATSQFFINVVDNPNLDAPNPDGHGYAVFGRIVQGMDVVDRIRTVPTGTNKGHQNVPATPIIVNKVSVAMPS